MPQPIDPHAIEAETPAQVVLWHNGSDMNHMRKVSYGSFKCVVFVDSEQSRNQLNEKAP